MCVSIVPKLQRVIAIEHYLTIRGSFHNSCKMLKDFHYYAPEGKRFITRSGSIHADIQRPIY